MFKLFGLNVIQERAQRFIQGVEKHWRQQKIYQAMDELKQANNQLRAEKEKLIEFCIKLCEANNDLARARLEKEFLTWLNWKKI